MLCCQDRLIRTAQTIHEGDGIIMQLDIGGFDNGYIARADSRHGFQRGFQRGFHLGRGVVEQDNVAPHVLKRNDPTFLAQSFILDSLNLIDAWCSSRIALLGRLDDLVAAPRRHGACIGAGISIYLIAVVALLTGGLLDAVAAHRVA